MNVDTTNPKGHTKISCTLLHTITMLHIFFIYKFCPYNDADEDFNVPPFAEDPHKYTLKKN